jgi:hypothetical protein
VKLDKELALWYCLRAINDWGSGRLDQTKAIYALTHNFNYSKSAAYRVLNEGFGKFWDKRDRNGSITIYLYSLKKIARYFNTRCGHYFLEIPILDFVGNGKNRVATQRTWLYACFYKPQGSDASPISRASIQEATGVRRRSQQRYDKVAVKSVANYANQQDSSGKLVPILELVSGKCRQWVVHKQLGNTYHCVANRGARGMLGKVNTALAQSLLRGEACVNRRFFTSVKSYLKCPRPHPEPYVLINRKDRLQPGRSEWCLI